jgi:hypothetical protein
LSIDVPVILSADFMILRLTTVHENAGSAGILPALAGHRALDDVAGRMPALPFPWQRGIVAVRFWVQQRATAGILRFAQNDERRIQDDSEWARNDMRRGF